MFSKKAITIDEIFTVDSTLCSKCQIDDEGFVNFCGLLENTNSILKGTLISEQYSLWLKFYKKAFKALS